MSISQRLRPRRIPTAKPKNIATRGRFLRLRVGALVWLGRRCRSLLHGHNIDVAALSWLSLAEQCYISQVTAPLGSSDVPIVDNVRPLGACRSACLTLLGLPRAPGAFRHVSQKSAVLTVLSARFLKDWGSSIMASYGCAASGGRRGSSGCLPNCNSAESLHKIWFKLRCRLGLAMPLIMKIAKLTLDLARHFLEGFNFVSYEKRLSNSGGWGNDGHGHS